MWIATIGLVANLLRLWCLRRFSDVERNLNVKSAYFHVLCFGRCIWFYRSADFFFVYYLAGWTWTNSFASIVVSIVMLRGRWRVFNESTRMIVEGSPRSISVEEVKHCIQQYPGVIEIKELYNLGHCFSKRLFGVTGGHPTGLQ